MFILFLYNKVLWEYLYKIEMLGLTSANLQLCFIYITYFTIFKNRSSKYHTHIDM